MPIEYLGLSEIKGPLVALNGVRNAAYDEIVELLDAKGFTTIIGKEVNELSYDEIDFLIFRNYFLIISIE